LLVLFLQPSVFMYPLSRTLFILSWSDIVECSEHC
jgi:hypothetical protein